MNRYGCVIFDGDQPGAGWASISGELPVKISGLGSLDSDIVWWTSLTSDHLYRSGLSSTPNIRSAEYLRTSMIQIRLELGISNRTQYSGKDSSNKLKSVAHSVQILSELFNRLMSLLEIHYGFKRPKYALLSDDLRALILPTDKSISAEIDSASELAYQKKVDCVTNPSRIRSRQVSFKLNRYHHAMDVLATPVPSNAFKLIDEADLPDSKPARLEWALKQTSPILVQASVTKVDPSLSSVIAFGVGSIHPRSWISHPELIVLSQFAQVNISSVFMFEEYLPIESILKVELPLIEDGLSELSMSVGLLCENFWSALAYPYKPIGASARIYTPRMAWLKATDRMLCMRSAIELYQVGFQVKNYGDGTVVVDVPNGNLSEVIDSAANAGLYPPIASIEDAIIQSTMA